MDNFPEICICAALRLPDGKIFRGHRHYDCITNAVWYVENILKQEWVSEMSLDQGFMTGRNRFVDRDEGLKLQLAAGIESIASDGYRSMLFSEDLY